MMMLTDKTLFSLYSSYTFPSKDAGIYEGVPSLLPALFKQKESHMLFSNENEVIVYTMMMELAQMDLYWS